MISTLKNSIKMLHKINNDQYHETRVSKCCRILIMISTLKNSIKMLQNINNGQFHEKLYQNAAEY